MPDRSGCLKVSLLELFGGDVRGRVHFVWDVVLDLIRPLFI